ncbi:hypothetical protein [Klebsiella pneumoniae]|uniref:hypothetical protein n=1 Tax=Klebsiella pneumoniae TaxID=573 RepID=UPI000535B4A5|nr:hypothetical protein [Klebsiella pneumoniae]AIX68215.1 hypothetical protein KPNIH29_06440 [Klebsiella pneumoniae subsp. pneumoniae]
MEKITDVLKELEKVTCRELAVYFDLTAPEMLARLMVLEREGKAQNLNGYWMPGGSTEPVAVTSKLTALDIKLLQSVPVGVWLSGSPWLVSLIALATAVNVWWPPGL